MKLKTFLMVLVGLSSALSIFVVPLPSAWTLSHGLLYVSAIAGYAGIMLLLWFYILGTRAVIKPFTRDMQPITRLHKLLGKYAPLLIFLHPLFITLSYGESWFYSILPNISTSFEKHVTLGRLSLAALVIVWFTSALLRRRIHYRPWKYIHLLAYASLPFALLHIPDVGTNYAQSFLPKLYFYFVLIGFGVFSLLRLRGALNFNKSRYAVISNKPIADGSYLLRLRSKTHSGLKPRRGQYIYLKTGWFSEEHPFSVISNDTKTNELSVAYKVYGQFTQQLTTLPTGAEVLVNGSFGSFTRQIDEEPNRPAVFVAGGIGITPFVSRLLDTSVEREQWLFYANRRSETAAFLRELQQVMGRHLISVFSDSTTTKTGHEPSKNVFTKNFSEHLDDPTRYHYFLCGPKSLMNDTQAELLRLGVSPSAIHREAFGH